MAETQRHPNEWPVHMEFSDGKTLSGRIQIPPDATPVKFLNQPITFLIVKTELGRTLIINKNYIVRLESQEQKSREIE